MAQQFCHTLVKKTAQKIAAEAYDELMRSNKGRFYDWWKAATPDMTPAEREKRYIQAMWAPFVPQARHTLGQMLNTPLSPALKDQISEALILDNHLRHGS